MAPTGTTCGEPSARSVVSVHRCRSVQNCRTAGSDKMAQALCRFARTYADQVERDHAALVQAVRRGALPAEAA